jgi:hypothetical protein
MGRNAGATPSRHQDGEQRADSNRPTVPSVSWSSQSKPCNRVGIEVEGAAACRGTGTTRPVAATDNQSSTPSHLVLLAARVLLGKVQLKLPLPTTTGTVIQARRSERQTERWRSDDADRWHNHCEQQLLYWHARQSSTLSSAYMHDAWRSKKTAPSSTD